MWNYITSITPNGWVAVGTWVLVLCTLAAVGWQVRAQRKANAVTFLIQLTEAWDSERMRKNRENVSHHLGAKSPVAPIKVGKLMAPVANFFELVGLLTRRRVLDREMVWSTFSYYAVLYFAALKKRIEDERRADQTLYTDFEWLYQQMQLDSRTTDEPTRQEIEDFVKNEPNN
jgi:hypothetical protein